MMCRSCSAAGRFLFAAAALAVFLAAAPSPGRAQAGQGVMKVVVPPGASEADIAAAIAAASKTGQQVELEVQPTAAAAASSTGTPSGQAEPPAAKASPAVTSLMQSSMTPDGMWMVRDLLTALGDGAQKAIEGLRHLPSAWHDNWRALQSEPEGFRGVALVALVAISLSIGIAGLVARIFALLAPLRHTRNHRINALIRALGDGLGILVFQMSARTVVHFGTAPESMSRQVAISIVTICVATASFAAIGRLLFRPATRYTEPLVAIGHTRFHFAMTVAYGALSAVIDNSVRLAAFGDLPPSVGDSWIFLSVSFLTLLKLVWLLIGRRDIAEAFGASAKGVWRRLMARLLPDFFAASVILIWLAGLLVIGTSQNEVWARAAGVSQIILIAVPVLDLWIFAVLGAMAQRVEIEKGPGLQSVTLWSLRLPLAGLIWVGGLQVILGLWNPLLVGAGMLATSSLAWLTRISFLAIMGLSTGRFLLRALEVVTPQQAPALPGASEDDTHKGSASRFTTIMPVVRSLLMAAVLCITVLMVASAGGLDVTPLLAGFGVLGLAFSFGSQTLVKDVVSGIFFLTEDAFRIGEYIDTGKLRGTVEQISLRSIRLRHHNGPVHTVPYGQIGAVTNYSRDWGTIKFELRFDREADLETIRKTAKRIGLAMMQDPEYADTFLVPLKMQGIQDVNENSLVVRFKFTCRPTGNPSLIKREGIKRMLAAFRDNGVRLASNAVMVRSGDEVHLADAGAAGVTALAPKPLLENG